MSTITTEAAFEVHDIVYRYSAEAAALDQLNFIVNPGQRIAIVGANGSGKSTLLRVLDGLFFPESGTVSVFGETLNEERLQDEAFAFKFRQQVALVFQNPDVQLFNPTVFDEVAFGPLQLRWPKARILQQVNEAMTLLDIQHLKDRSPHRLSGGEKKRVALASVLVLNPDVLLLDEPTASLDPKSQSQVIDFLVGWGGGAKTVVTATHDLDTLEDIADLCYVFQRGKVVASGTPADILSNETLLRETNLIHAHRHSHRGGVHMHPHRHAHHEHVA